MDLAFWPICTHADEKMLQAIARFGLMTMVFTFSGCVVEDLGPAVAAAQRRLCVGRPPPV